MVDFLPHLRISERLSNQVGRAHQDKRTCNHREFQENLCLFIDVLLHFNCFDARLIADPYNGFDFDHSLFQIHDHISVEYEVRENERDYDILSDKVHSLSGRVS